MFKIRTDTRELIIRDDGEEGYFNLCCSILLGGGTKNAADTLPQKEPLPAGAGLESTILKEKELPEQECRAESGVGGFLHIVCGHCGAEKTFCAKSKMTYYKCGECGEKTGLDRDGLRDLYVNCECGKNSHYLTNSTDGAFDINCIRCGSPTAVEWNSKKKCYMTIQEG